jgi:hypothetical protein
MLYIVDLTEEIPPMVAADLVPLREIRRAVPTRETVGVKQSVADLARPVGLREDELAGRAARSKHAVEVGAAVELAELGEAGVGEGQAAASATQAVLV